MRVLLVDGQVMVREGLTLLLEADSEIRVVGQASSSDEALEILGGTECDVAVVEAQLPEEGGSRCIREIRRRHPRLPILVLSHAPAPQGVATAVQAGANGFLVKRAGPGELRAALRAVLMGGFYFHSEVAAQVVQALQGLSEEEEGAVELTDSEIAILALISQGRNNSEIGRLHHLSVSTVKSRIRSLFRKLGVDDRTSLIVEAMKRDLLPGGGTDPSQ